MRVALLALALAVAASSPAPAQERSRYTTPAPQAPAAAGLRGPLAPTAPALPSAPAAPGVEAPAGEAAAGTALGRWVAPSDRGAETRCRAACDRTYYQCLSSDDGETCPASWGQCRSRCERRRS